MNIIIEEAHSSDANEILEFTKLIGGESDNLTFGKEGVSYSLEDEINYINSMLDSNSNIFLVARNNNKIVGTANYNTFASMRMNHRGELSVSVLKEYWNNGIGSMLIRELLQFAKQSAKAQIVSLEVRSDNLSAIHLYRKFGFEKIGTFKGYFKIDGKLVDFDIMQLVF